MTSDRATTPILLVEDDPLLGATMRRYLQRWSGDVRVAETCKEAVAAWSGMPRGLVLMDYRLPDGFGTDVVAGMRRKGRVDPVICMTGEAETISAETQKELDVRAVLGKPVKLDGLRQEIELAWSGQAATEEPTARARRERHEGKYRRIVWKGALDGRRLARVCRAARGEAWVALDVTEARSIDAEARRGICAWSGWLSGNGGHLCVVVRDAERRGRIRDEIGEYVDVAEDVSKVAVRSARLTGDAERRRLLGLIFAHGPKGAGNG